MPQGLTIPSAASLPLISVIIPTYNRKDSLLYTLESLVRQIYPADRFQVVVVDDGSNDSTGQVAEITYPFELVYLKQTNQGSAAARNHGAEKSAGEILLFIDDDMTLDPGYIAAMVNKTSAGVITMGVWYPYEPPDCSHFCRVTAQQLRAQTARTPDDEPVGFSECTSNNLAVCRVDFLRAGMWRDVLGDGPTLWGDVEFGYRAWKEGCRFVRVADARIIHRDQHGVNLAAATKRACHVSKIVQPLFGLHPEIQEHLLMFQDKGPILWRDDPAMRILRKLARQVAASRPVMWAMESTVLMLERRAPDSTALQLLYRWIISGYIYRGYRQGLREIAR